MVLPQQFRQQSLLISEIDSKLQRDRFEAQAKEKKEIYNYELPEPRDFYTSLNNYPKSAGIALGVERLLRALTKVENPFWK